MLNEDRIRLMTKLASYETREKGSDAVAGKYFRSDYIGLNMLKSVIAATLAFIIGVSVLIFYNFELAMKEIYQLDLLNTGKKVLVTYVVFIVIYCIVCYAVFSWKYAKARRGMSAYNQNLVALAGLYRQGRQQGGESER